MGKRPNIDTIADAAFVSRSVVSRVLNNRPNVSPQARKRVLEAIKKYDYVPSSAARSLATSKTQEVSILAPRRKDDVFANAFWSLVFLGLSEACIQRGFYGTLNVISEDFEPQLKHSILNSRRVDGFVLIGQDVASLAMESVEAMGKPAIMLGHAPQHDSVPSVDTDNVEGARKATKHLIELGHQRIGVVAGRMQAQEVLDRVDGYYKAHEELGLATHKDLVVSGEFSHQSGYKCMQRLLLHRPTAVFCTSDAQAMGALLAIREAGLSVPGDVSVVGYDDLPAARFTIPPLTTIRQPIYTMGHQVSNSLIDIIEGQRTGPKRLLMQPTLVVRDSCGPANA